MVNSGSVLDRPLIGMIEHFGLDVSNSILPAVVVNSLAHDGVGSCMTQPFGDFGGVGSYPVRLFRVD